MRPLAGTNVSHRARLVCGRGEAGFDEAEVVVEGEWTTASAQHAPMEPHACLAEWQDGRLTIWTGTQTPFNIRRELAGTFRLAETDVRIVALPMGGSFGAKTFTRIEAIAAALATPRRRPVKLVLARDELFLTLNRHPTRSRGTSRSEA
jgi:CO/xanthine dehydrogenase Mo-binding subunit